MKTREKLGLAVLIAAGAILRYGGMSHDLHEGKVYHPDTPKQIRAIQSFYVGQYFQHIGHRDYDGYPLFTSHLVEYACRILEPARRGVLHLIGVPVSKDLLLDWGILYWLTLILNATLSTLAIAVVYRIGRENFTPGMAFAAALFQTLSPIDVTACHYATGDTSAAFFATLSLLYAFRICRLGRRRDYVLAAATAVFGFAAKYHAGMAVFPIVAAHIARTGGPASWFKADSLARVGWTALAAIAALFLAIPSLFSHFGMAGSDILAAFSNSSSRVPPELRDAGRFDKFIFSMKTNLPVLYRILGPAATAAVAASLLTRLRRQAAVYILLSLPVMYFALGVGSKTLVHPVYHAVMVPPMFLLAAFCFARRLPPGANWRVTACAGSTAILLWAAAFLGQGALRELFFQWHMDTRRMASRWMQENVPATFEAVKGRYTFSWGRPASSGSASQGTLYLQGRLGPADVPADAIPLKRFVLERDPLMQFRNVGIESFVGRTTLLRQGFSLPVNQRCPSRTGNQVDFDNGLQFYQNDRLVVVEPEQEVVRWIVADAPLREAWLIVQGGAIPASVTASLGGEHLQTRLQGGESAVLPIAVPCARFPSGDGLHFYEMVLRGGGGRVRALLARCPGEAGRMLFNLGRYADAAPLLARGAREETDPAAAAQAIISSRIAGLAQAQDARLGELAGRVLDVRDDDSLFEAYGIRTAYLDALPFARLRASEFVVEGFGRAIEPDQDADEDDADRGKPRVVQGAKRDRYFAATPELMLDPGHYTASVDLGAIGSIDRSQELRAQLSDTRGLVLSDQPLALSPMKAGQYASIKFSVVVPVGVPEVRIALVAQQRLDIAIVGMELRPSPLANAMALATVLRLVQEGGAAAASGEPMAYDALMALGRERAKGDRAKDAADCFAAAAALRPPLAAPVAELARLWAALPAEDRQALEPLKRRADEVGKGTTTLPADVAFDGGIRLARVVLRETSVARGGKLGLNLLWRLDGDLGGASRPQVWVHFVDESGKIVFQGDHDLKRDLRLPGEPVELSPFFNEVEIRPTVPAGEYRIRIGLYHPASRTTVKVRSSKLLPVEKDKRVILPLRIAVTDG